jgi:tetratricopeptide (TPR) repeat protein
MRLGRRSPAAPLAWALAAALLCAAAPAQAATPDRAAATARFAEAERAAAELRFAEALRGYQEALAADPSAPFARTARSRADWIAARAEGGFGPLGRLAEAQRDPARLRDEAAATAWEKEIEGFPPGRVRVEARALLAGALRERQPERAAGVLERLLADPAADAVTRALALRQVVDFHRDRGDLGAARAAVLRHQDVAPELRRDVLRLARRVTLRWAAVGALAGVGIAAGAALARAGRRAGDAIRTAAHPIVVGLALYVGAAGAVLARLHGDADPRPFVWLGLGALAVAVAARALRAALPGMGAGARAAWALCCVVGVLAAAFLALERTNAGYLESFGL